MKLIIIVGGPYAGKGTQSTILGKALNYRHISLGEFCRNEKAKKTNLGNRLSKFKDNGGLIPDTIIKQIVTDIFNSNSAEKGIILEGFPITYHD